MWEPSYDLDHEQQLFTWPRYQDGKFSHGGSGESMLDLTEEELRALQIVVLRTDVRKEQFGAVHQFNWKKVGLSRANFKRELLSADRMPTPRAAAAFEYLMQTYHVWSPEDTERRRKKTKEGMPLSLEDIESYYARLHREHRRRLDAHESLNISSYDLFANMKYRGIECAMFPHLYPQSHFTDTGRLELYQDMSEDDTNRVVSIGSSWTRKVLSSVRAYGEQRDLAFFLYEREQASKFFAAQHMAKRMGITADVLTRDSQASTGYWEIVQDALADLVRIMLLRCYDQQHCPQLYHHCRKLRGQVWLCAFPNFFCTIALEWRQQRARVTPGSPL